MSKPYRIPLASRKPKSIQIGKICVKHPDFGGKRSGGRGVCIGCTKGRMDAWKKLNPTFKKDYYHANKERQDETTKAWREANHERMVATHKAYYSANQQKYLQHAKEYRAKTAERRREYRRANKQRDYDHQKVWRANNKVKVDAWSKRWRDKNKMRVAAYARNQEQLRKRIVGGQALARRYMKEIQEIYRNCPKGYHVDHIVPLRGKGVNGLHVPWNLQYLPARENSSKGNRHE